MGEQRKNRLSMRFLATALAVVMLLANVPLVSLAEEIVDTDITAITRPATRGVIVNYDEWVENLDQSLNLPTTVTLTLADSTTVEAGVTWDTSSLNVKKTGKYNLPGTVTLPEGATNTQNLKVYQVIKVQEQTNILTNGSFENGTSGWETPTASFATLSVVEDSAAADGTSVAKLTKSEKIKTAMRQILTSKMKNYGPGEYYISAAAKLGEEQVDTSKAYFFAQYAWDATLDGTGTSGAESTYYGKTIVDGKANAQVKKVAMTTEGYQVFDRRILVTDYDTLKLATFNISVTYGNDTQAVTAFYVDDVKMIPLNIELPYDADDDITDLEEISTVSDLPVKAIIENYDQWVVDANTSLRLPEAVEVTTDTGRNVSVKVQWDTSDLKYNTVGEYILTGTLNAAEAGLSNAQDLKATQKVLVRTYQNILKNPSFEEGVSDWKKVSGPIHNSITDPVQDGTYAIQAEISQKSQRANYISQDITAALNTYGAGEYYISTWGQLGAGAETTDGDAYWTRMDIKADGGDWVYVGTSWISNETFSPAADSADGTKAPVTNQTVKITSGQWSQSHRRVMLNFDKIDEARIEVGVTGGTSYVTKIYIDHAELVPLNVTIPEAQTNPTDITSYTTPAEVRAYEGTDFQDLSLPEKLNVTLKNGTTKDVPVTWSETGYAATVGSYTISGTFDLSELDVSNTKGIKPQIKVLIRKHDAGLRDTYYFSTSGNDSNDGLSEETPLKDVTKIPELLKSGANVVLKRGDIWYLPEFCLNVDGVKGTSDNRVVLGAYGDENDAKPILAFMYQRTVNEWTSEGNNVYSTDISELTAKNINGVMRVFVDGTVYSSSTLVKGYRNSDEDSLSYLDDPANLEAKEFCVQGDKVYIKTEGQTFSNVELVPYVSYGHRLTGTDVSYLTIENLDFRGGSSTWAFAWFGAPSCGLLIENTDFLYVNKYIIQFSMTGITSGTHVNPTIRKCTFDGMATEAEGADYRIIHGWQSLELREAIDGALIENNVFRNVGHAAVELSMPGSNKNAAMSSVVSGVKNCVIQNNLIEGVNAGYARAFTITGHTNVGETSDMVHDNIFRWNRCYGMTTSSHVLGENNAVYGNIFAFSNVRYDGWNGQPYALDTVMWNITNGKHVSKHNVILNNTIYGDVAGIAIAGSGENVTDNLYANNLFVNHSNTNSIYKGGIGVDWTSGEGTLYILNNGFYTSWSTDQTAIGWDGKDYTAQTANLMIATAENNLDAAPSFVNVDESVKTKYQECFDFSLTDTSAYRYAGVDVNDLGETLLNKFPILKKLDSADETGIQLKDMKGNDYLLDTPSVGAISYTKTLSGKVASVEEMETRTVKTGTSFEVLGLPKTVEVTLEDGTTAKLPVSWDESSYDASKSGTYLVKGTLSTGAHTGLNLNDKNAVCSITVKEKLEIKQLLEVNGVTVANGTAAEDVPLPATCKALLEDGTTVTLNLSWSAPSDYQPTVMGNYVFTGTPTLGADVANSDALSYRVTVTVQKKLEKGDELLLNPDFVENGSYDPWCMGWAASQGTMEVTTDPTLVKPGEAGAMIVTVNTKYSGIQQDVTAQVKAMGNGKYLFELWMRAKDEGTTILTTKIDLQAGKDYLGTAHTNIGTEYVQIREILDITTADTAEKILFHTSTMKDKDDVGKSIVISGCSLIYLGANDAEASVTLSKLALTWDTIKGDNENQNTVMSNLVLPVLGENGATITWESSDESVISANGIVSRGSKEKTVTLTAKITNGDYSDSVKLTLKVPGNTSTKQGYTASIATVDTDVNVGDTVTVIVNVGATGFENVASSELKFTYDADVFAFEAITATKGIPTAKADKGVLTIEDYGESKELGNVYTLTFTTKKATETTDLKLTSAAFSTQESATKENLTAATISADTVSVKVTLRHDIEKPDYVNGTTTVENGNNYTFTAKDTNLYDYTFSATVDGERVDVIQNADGSCTVQNVTGKLVISGTRTPKTFTVTIKEPEKNDRTDNATYNTDYTYTIPSYNGYTVSVDVTYADDTKVPTATSESTLTIAGKDIIGNITITVTKTLIPPTTATVQVEGNAVSDVTYEETAEPNADYTFTVAMDSKYDYTVSAKNGEENLKLTEGENGSYTISKADFKAGDTIVITVDKTIKTSNVEVKDYLTIDQAKMWLILVETDKLENGTYTYRNNKMFWSEKYSAYCYLVISSTEAPTVTAENLAIVNESATEVDDGMDVNMSGKVDANDAQLVYNIYNAHYSAFTDDVTMEKFLRADTNGDCHINVEDAQIIINHLLG